MKKLAAVLLAGVLVFGVSVTAFATQSPSGSTQDTLINAELQGQPDWHLIISQDYPTQEEADAAAALRQNPQTQLESTPGVGAEEAQGMKLVTVMDVKVVGEGKNPPYTVRFYVPGVTASSRVIVLHYFNGAWQKESPALGDGTVTVTFSDLSPVAIYVDEETANNAGTSGTDSTASAGSGTVSPKTGEMPVMPVIAVVAVCAAVGMTVSVRRKYV